VPGRILRTQKEHGQKVERRKKPCAHRTGFAEWRRIDRLLIEDAQKNAAPRNVNKDSWDHKNHGIWTREEIRRWEEGAKKSK